MATTGKRKRTQKNTLPVGWTPQMQFSKRIARVVIAVWILFISVVLCMLVIWHEVDAMMALTGWVTSVMITMVGAYTGNSMYEKHLDKGLSSGLYRYRSARKAEDDEDEELEEESDFESRDSDFDDSEETVEAGGEADSYG